MDASYGGLFRYEEGHRLCIIAKDAGNQSFRKTDLQAAFGEFGHIIRIEVCKPPKQGVAFVDFQDRRDGSQAINVMDHRKINGVEVTVNWANPKPKKPNARQSPGRPRHPFEHRSPSPKRRSPSPRQDSPTHSERSASPVRCRPSPTPLRRSRSPKRLSPDSDHHSAPTQRKSPSGRSSPAHAAGPGEQDSPVPKVHSRKTHRRRGEVSWGRRSKHRRQQQHPPIAKNGARGHSEEIHKTGSISETQSVDASDAVLPTNKSSNANVSEELRAERSEGRRSPDREHRSTRSLTKDPPSKCTSPARHRSKSPKVPGTTVEDPSDGKIDACNRGVSSLGVTAGVHVRNGNGEHAAANSICIIVENLPEDMEAGELQQLGLDFGQCTSAKILSLRVGQLEFSPDSDVQLAIKTLDRRRFVGSDKKRLKVYKKLS